MANLVILNQKIAKMLDQKKTFLNQCKVRLFISNITPNQADTTATYSAHECTDSGYAAQTPVFPSASASGGVATATAPTLTFTFNHNAGDFTVYGWYLTDTSDSDNVVMAQAETPFTCTGAGQTYTVAPVMQDQSIP